MRRRRLGQGNPMDGLLPLGGGMITRIEPIAALIDRVLVERMLAPHRSPVGSPGFLPRKTPRRARVSPLEDTSLPRSLFARSRGSLHPARLEQASLGSRRTTPSIRAPRSRARSC